MNKPTACLNSQITVEELQAMCEQPQIVAIKTLTWYGPANGGHVDYYSAGSKKITFFPLTGTYSVTYHRSGGGVYKGEQTYYDGENIELAVKYYNQIEKEFFSDLNLVEYKR